MSAGKFAFCVTESGAMCVFDLQTGKLEETVAVVKATPSERSSAVSSVVHHPFRNILSTIESSGLLRFWRP